MKENNISPYQNRLFGRILKQQSRVWGNWKSHTGPSVRNKCSSKSELINFPQPISIWGFPDGSDGKESTCQCRRQGLDSWVGVNGYPFQYSCLENFKASVHLLKIRHSSVAMFFQGDTHVYFIDENKYSC